MSIIVPDVWIQISMSKPSRVVCISNEVEDLLGYMPEAFISGHQTIQQCIHPQDSDIAASLFLPSLDPPNGSFNIRLRHANGKIRCVRGAYEKQIIIGRENIQLDILLQDSKSLPSTMDDPMAMVNFRAMMENTDDYIYFKDRNHVFTGASQTLVTLCDPAEHWTDLLGLTDYDVFPEELADKYYDLEKRVFSGEKVAHEVQETLSNDGKKGWVDNRKYPIKDEQGKFLGLYGIARDITDTKEALERIEKLAMHVPGVIFQFQLWPDGHSTFPYASEGINSIYGVRPEEVKKDATAVFNVLHPDDIERIRTTIINSADELTVWQQSYRVILPEGQPFWVEGEATPEHMPDGSTLWHGYIHNIDKRIQTEEALKKAEEQSRLLLQYSDEGIFGLDLEGITTFVNPSALKMLGYSAEEIIGKKNHELIHHSLANGKTIPLSECRMFKATSEETDFHVDTEVFWRKDGTFFPIEYRSTPVFRENQLVGAVVTFHDISKRRQAEKQIYNMAFHDSLTGLPNRRYFFNSLNQEIKNSYRYRSRFAVLILDLDHFKEVNDTLGHPVGDLLLKYTAELLKDNTRSSDIIARLGGDEFIILMPRIDDESEAAILANHLINRLSLPVRLNDQQIISGVSIGIVLSDEGKQNADDILARCDVALYRAKDSGRGNFVFYLQEMTERVKQEAKIAQHLSQAIVNRELRLVFQPKINVHDSSICGFEALIRWRSSILGDVSPAYFIPIAEKRGMINKIGSWVIQQLCVVIRDFIERGIDTGRIAFNLSRIQLQNLEHFESIFKVIEESNLPLNLFEVEITETAFSEIRKSVMLKLEEMNEKGLLVAIDDFGTGYSSMVSLRDFNARYLKVDYEFIRDMLIDKNDQVIVKATIQIAHSLHKQVIAEGVETSEQFNLLKELNCDMVQGFLFSKPLEVDEVATFLNTYPVSSSR